MHRNRKVLGVCGLAGLAALNIWFVSGMRMVREDSRDVVVLQDLQCGHWALIRCCHLLGLPLSERDAVTLLPYQRATGVSLLELKEALEELGFHVVAESLSLDEALLKTKQRRPVVLHLTDPDHFVVLSRQAERDVIVFDAAGRRRRLPLDVVRKRFDGYTLAVSRGESDSALPVFANRDTKNSPCLQFETLYVDRGDIPVHQRTVTYEFPLENLGAVPLKITRLAGDCSCLQVEGPDIVPPHTGAVIRATFSHLPGESRTTFEHEIAVETNDPVLRSVALIAAGNTNTNLMAIPFSVDFGQVAAGQSQVRRCFVHYNGQQDSVLEQADFHCTLAGSELRVLTREEYREEHPLRQNLVESRSAPGHVRVVEIIWSPGSESAGESVTGVFRVVPPIEGLAPIEVPISGAVRPVDED